MKSSSMAPAKGVIIRNDYKMIRENGLFHLVPRSCHLYVDEQ